MEEARKSEPIPDVPAYILQRHDSWRRIWRRNAGLHYSLGIASVVSSSAAAAIGGYSPHYGQACAALASILTAALGFLQPRRMHSKFLRGWRMLDVEILKYQAGLATKADLVNTVVGAEDFFTKFEEESSDPVKHGRTVTSVTPDKTAKPT